MKYIPNLLNQKINLWKKIANVPDTLVTSIVVKNNEINMILDLVKNKETVEYFIKFKKHWNKMWNLSNH